jgi:hypothetical protein
LVDFFLLHFLIECSQTEEEKVPEILDKVNAIKIAKDEGERERKRRTQRGSLHTINSIPWDRTTRYRLTDRLTNRGLHELGIPLSLIDNPTGFLHLGPGSYFISFI